MLPCLWQVCFGVAVHVSLQLKQNVIYVDTTGGLSASRLLQMLRAQTCNVEEQVERTKTKKKHLQANVI